MALNMDSIENLPLVQKALIVVAIILLIYVVFYFGYVSNKKKTLDKMQQDLTKLNYEVSQGKAVMTKIEEYQAKQAELERQLKEAEKRLPREAKIPELLEKLSDLARGNGLKMPTFRPGKITSGCGGICKEIALSVSFNGEYNDIAKFLDQVSKLERIVGVKSVIFKPIGGGSGKGKKSDEGQEEKRLLVNTDANLVTYMFAGQGKPADTGSKKRRRRR